MGIFQIVSRRRNLYFSAIRVCNFVVVIVVVLSALLAFYFGNYPETSI